MENVMEINVLRLLEKTAQKYGDKTAYSDTDNSITFAEIEDKAKRMGSALAEKVTPRSPVAVMTGSGIHIDRHSCIPFPSHYFLQT